MIILRISPFLIFALSLGVISISAASAITDSIDTLTEDVVKVAPLAGETVVVSANDMYDAATGRNALFSEILREAVAQSLTKRGITIRKGATTDAHQWAIHLLWKINDSNLNFTYIARLLVNASEEGKAISRSAKIPVSAIDAELLKPDAKSFARTLVRTLEKNTSYKSVRTVHLRPVHAPQDTDTRKVGKYFDDWIKLALDESSLFHRLEQNELYKTPVKELRSRAIRRSDKVGSNNMSLASDMLKAESEIHSNVKLDANSAAVIADVNDRDGRKISTASVNFDASLLPSIVTNELSSGGHKPQEVSRHSGFSHKGLEVELATTHGEGVSVYHEGEKIRFFIRINRDAYIYLFNLDSKGEATLIYPEPNGKHPKVKANTPTVIPDDGLNYEFKVMKPFGKETILAVATEKKSQIPSELSGDWAKADTAPILLRKLGTTSPGGYAESIIEVVTTE